MIQTAARKVQKESNSFFILSFFETYPFFLDKSGVFYYNDIGVMRTKYIIWRFS